MTDQTTTVTDDERKAHEWAHTNRGGSHDSVARAILRHVPPPPKSLADELRDLNKQDIPLGALLDLADRVENVEKENKGLAYDCKVLKAKYKAASEERAACHNEVERLQDVQAENSGTIARLTRDLAEARAEVGGKTAQKGEESNAETPDPADVPEGEAWLVRDEQELSIAVRDTERWVLIHLNDATTRYRRIQHITLVSRLVPDTRRVIDRPEDLDALLTESVVLDKNSASSQKTPSGYWECGHDALTAKELIDSYGPVTVIHVPEVVE